MAYKVVEIYKDLPHRAGCNDCGKPGCFAFATAAHLEGLPFDKCPHLSEKQLCEMVQKAQTSRASGEGPRETPEQQAAALLQEKVKAADFAAIARRAQAEHVSETPEALRVSLFERSYLVQRDGVVADDKGEVDVWSKVLLMMYLTKASGEGAKGEWIAYRELPNTISKRVTYEKWIDRIPKAFAGRFDSLEEAVSTLGGEAVPHESADLALRIQALPRVPLLLLLWEADADFEARGSLLLDSGVLGYIDQEALTFLAEELMRRLTSVSPT